MISKTSVLGLSIDKLSYEEGGGGGGRICRETNQGYEEFTLD